MKKTLLIMIYVLAAAWVSAQSHSFREISYVPYWQFDYDAWVFEDIVHNGKHSSQPTHPDRGRCVLNYDDILQYNYTDDTAGMKVVGLSATIFLVKAQLSTEVPPEYLLLYEATPDSFILKAQVQWDETDTAGRPTPSFWLNTIDCHNTLGNSLIYGPIYGENNPLYAVKTFDYYFDKPIVVYDSFYVGGTSRGLTCMFTHEPIPASYSQYITFRPNQVYFDSTCLFPALWKLYRYSFHDHYPVNQWYWMPSNQFLMILPIIEVVDTSFANAPECPVVSGLFLRGNYTDTVTVQWDYDSLHAEYQLWYGPEADFETNSTMVSLRTNKWVFSDASYADKQMIAYVRTVCHEYDTLRYSEWGRPIRFMLHHEEQDTTGHGNISVPEEDELSRYVQLMPNPASGSVLVSSSYSISRVEAFDVRGEKVMEQPTEGQTAVIDVTAWPKGAYVVLVHTPQGTAAKRLVVQ